MARSSLLRGIRVTRVRMDSVKNQWVSKNCGSPSAAQFVPSALRLLTSSTSVLHLSMKYKCWEPSPSFNALTVPSSILTLLFSPPSTSVGLTRQQLQHRRLGCKFRLCNLQSVIQGEVSNDREPPFPLNSRSKTSSQTQEYQSVLLAHVLCHASK